MSWDAATADRNAVERIKQSSEAYLAAASTDLARLSRISVDEDDAKEDDCFLKDSDCISLLIFVEEDCNEDEDTFDLKPTPYP